MKKFYFKLNWSQEWNFMLHQKSINFWQTDNFENQWTIVSSKTKVSYWLLTTLQKYPNIFSLYERSQQNIWIFQWLRYKYSIYIVIFWTIFCSMNFIEIHIYNVEMQSTSFNIEKHWLFKMKDAPFWYFSTRFRFTFASFKRLANFCLTIQRTFQKAFDHLHNIFMPICNIQGRVFTSFYSLLQVGSSGEQSINNFFVPTLSS